MLGLAYFINLNISLSLWLFYLIAYFQDAAFGVMGIHSQADLGHWSVPIRGHLMMGAIVGLAGCDLVERSAPSQSRPAARLGWNRCSG